MRHELSFLPPPEFGILTGAFSARFFSSFNMTNANAVSIDRLNHTTSEVAVLAVGGIGLDRTHQTLPRSSVRRPIPWRRSGVFGSQRVLPPRS